MTDFLNGGLWEIAAEFTEVESGKDDTNRPQLAKAFAAGRAYGARHRADSLRCRFGRALGESDGLGSSFVLYRLRRLLLDDSLDIDCKDTRSRLPDDFSHPRNITS